MIMGRMTDVTHLRQTHLRRYGILLPLYVIDLLHMHLQCGSVSHGTDQPSISKTRQTDKVNKQLVNTAERPTR